VVKLEDIVTLLDLEVISPPLDPQVVISQACVSDLLSFIMASCPGNCLWVTAQSHANVVGVAQLLDMQAVILAEGNRPDTSFIAKAKEAGIPVFISKEGSFAICGKLYGMGLAGKV